MYRICVRRHFDAAHALRGYQGRCENLHGHRYEVVACVRKRELNEIGLAFDFTEFKRELDAILDGLDHRNLTPSTNAILARRTSPGSSTTLCRTRSRTCRWSTCRSTNHPTHG